MRLHKSENLLIGLIFIFLTACGGPPLAQPEGQNTTTPTIVTEETPITTPVVSEEPLPETTATLAAIDELLVATPVSPLPTPIATEPPGGGYSADKISIVPEELALKNPPDLSTGSQMLFNSWSNSGKKFAFIVPLPQEIADPNPPEGTNKTFRAAELWIANIDGTDTQKIADQMGDFALWSPDDTKIAYFKLIGVFSREVWIVDLKTNTSIKLDEPAGIDMGNTNYYGSIVWLDNHRLLYATYAKTGNRHLWVHDVQTGKIGPVQVTDKLATALGSFWLAPNKTAIVGSTLNELWLGQLIEDGGQFKFDHIKVLLTENGLIPFWSPDSTKLAIVSIGLLQNQLRIMDIKSGNITEIPFELAVVATEWSPDSQVLIVSNYVTGSGPKSHPIYIVNANGSGLRLLDNSSDTFIKWSPDGNYMFWKNPETENAPRNTINFLKVELRQ